MNKVISSLLDIISSIVGEFSLIFAVLWPNHHVDEQHMICAD